MPRPVRARAPSPRWTVSTRPAGGAGLRGGTPDPSVHEGKDVANVGRGAGRRATLRPTIEGNGGRVLFESCVMGAMAMSIGCPDVVTGSSGADDGLLSAAAAP